MSKPKSYLYTGTKGHIIDIAHSLPTSPKDLLKSGWEDISDPNEVVHGHYKYKESATGLGVRFDKKKDGAPGFRGKDHYHIMNPNTTGNSDLYLDINGNPVKKNSKASHILPNGGK